MITGRNILITILLLITASVQSQILLIAVEGEKIVKTFDDYEVAIQYFTKNPKFSGTIYSVSEAELESFVIIVPTAEEIEAELEDDFDEDDSNVPFEPDDTDSNKSKLLEILPKLSFEDLMGMFNKTNGNRNPAYPYSLIEICDILEIDNTGTKKKIAERIFNFFSTP